MNLPIDRVYSIQESKKVSFTLKQSRGVGNGQVWFGVLITFKCNNDIQSYVGFFPCLLLLSLRYSYMLHHCNVVHVLPFCFADCLGNIGGRRDKMVTKELQYSDEGYETIST